MIVIVPTGGFVGTMVLATDTGVATYPVSIPAGSHEVGSTGNGRGFPGTALIGQVIRDGVLTVAESDAIEAVFVAAGAPASYGANTNFDFYWQQRRGLDVFPMIDTSSGISFNWTWLGYNGTTFPLLDLSSGLYFERAWQQSDIISFPACDLSAGLNFSNVFRNASLEVFPPNMFDNCAATDFSGGFQNCKLDQASVNGILVSIESNGTYNGRLDMHGQTSAAPSGAGATAVTALEARGWVVNTN
jgi:hypothetical protein